jgi:hypothetical protein
MDLTMIEYALKILKRSNEIVIKSIKLNPKSNYTIRPQIFNSIESDLKPEEDEVSELSMKNLQPQEDICEELQK